MGYNLKEVREVVRLEGAALAVGESTYTDCPYCGDTRRKFSISRVETGLLYNCFRDSCIASGMVHEMPPVKGLVPVTKRTHPRIYSGSLRDLTVAENRLLDIQMELSQEVLAMNKVSMTDSDPTRLFMPIFDVSGKIVGAQAKLWKLPPYKNVPKVETYWTQTSPADYAYPLNEIDGKVSLCNDFIGEGIVVVEDMLSAMKVCQLMPCIALLGTTMHEGAAKAAAMLGTKLIIYLDDDVWEPKNKQVGKQHISPIKIKHAYGHLFKDGVSFIRTKGDPKVTNLEEIQDALINVLTTE